MRASGVTERGEDVRLVQPVQEVKELPEDRGPGVGRFQELIRGRVRTPATARVRLGRIWPPAVGTFARIIDGTGPGGDLQGRCAATSQQWESGYVIESITLSAEGSPKEGSPSRRSARSLTLPVISWHGTE